MTGRDVLNKIGAFTEERWERAYSFAHIVLGDFNLSAAHISGCLEDDDVNEWFAREVESIPDWDQYGLDYDYEELLSEHQIITDFLIELLNIPAVTRDEAETLHLENCDIA